MNRRKSTGLALALAVFATQSPALGQGPPGDESGGEIAFNTHCRTCHSMKAGDNRLGPSLHGIVGAKAGAVAGFGNYSGMLTGITWDEATLDKFMADPESLAPNTSMKPYAGMTNADERRKIIEFLKTAGRS